jgi:hypothetical protein
MKVESDQSESVALRHFDAQVRRALDAEAERDRYLAALAEKIDRCDWDSRGREHMIMVTCWNWFSGGDTAAAVAAKIEAALLA